MKSKVVRLLLAAAIGLSPVISVSGQQQVGLTPEEAQIKQYRDDIQRLAAKTPSPEAQESHRNALLKLRKALARLLTEKIGALKKDIRDLSPGASAALQEHVKELGRILQSVEDEVQGLDRDMEQGMSFAAVNAPPTPRPSPSPEASPLTTTTPTPSLTRLEETQRNSLIAAVNNVSDNDLKEAAAPPEVTKNKLPESDCDEDGQAILPTASKFEQAVCGLAGNVNDRRDTRIILLSGDKGTLFPIMIAKLLKTSGDESFVSFITEAQEARTDQQIGAGPSSNGTTSLVVKGGVPYALGFAVENGAAVQSQSDTTVTFRLNPAGVLNLFSNKGFITGFRQTENDSVLKFLRKSSIGLTFDTTRGTEPGVFTGTKQQLSAFSYRVEFFNERDPRHVKYEKDWEQFVADEGIPLAQVIYATTLALNNFGVTENDQESFKDPALQAWLIQTNGRIEKVAATLGAQARINEIAKIIREQADLLPVDLVTDETVEAITNFAKQFRTYSIRKKELLDKIARGRIFTLEYTNKREVTAPDTSNFNFILGTGTGNRIDLTANGSITLFNKRPTPLLPTSPKIGRVRDFQFAGQVDVPFTVGEVGQFVLWFSGRYERLMEDASTLAGAIIPGTKGDIAVGQIGIKVPIKGLGMKIPFSITFANRTELVKEKEVRGNFGFTFNLDTLFSKFKPF